MQRVRLQWLILWPLRLAVILTILVAVAVLLGKVLPAGDRFSVAELNGTATDIFALDLTRDVQMNLTRNPASDLQEAWSPDGSRMAFISDRGGTLQLYLLTIGRGGGVRLLDAQDIAPNYRPVWSSDGTALVYEVLKPGGSEIALVRVDQPLIGGRNPRVLASSFNPDRYPVWSPDGTEIAFTSWRNGDAEIFVVKPDGSGLTNLTKTDNDDASPAWSPDGQQIAFFSLRSQFRELYVMKRDGSDLRQISDAQQTGDGNYWGAPLWSPDGQSIAYQAIIDNQPSIVVVGLDGSVQRHLINPRQGLNTNATLPNGKRLAYLATIGARTLLYMTDADGGSPHALTPMDAAQPFAGLWGNPAS
ncbi:MAG: hypothetical protein ABI700_17690 [Chloroflexota bacterium]